MSGVNMSGDLKHPGRSIPRGTLAAVGVGYLIYMVLPVFLAARAGSQQLIADPMIMRRMAFWGDAILLGVWGATLSSAVGSIMGAPRVLQALARDGILPGPLRVLGKGSGDDDTPRVGTTVTLVIALGAVWFGDLNLIAPILTMFFLTTYGVLNVSAGLERALGSPSFRPRFRVPWYLSALGAVGCVTVMFLINAGATVVAAIIVVSIYVWLQRRELQTTWGDVRRGLWMAVTRAGLFRLQDATDPKNWRPHLLVLSGAPTKRWYLIEFANWIAHRRALVTVSSVLTDDGITLDRQRGMERTISDYLAKRGVHALIRMIRAPDPFEGATRLIEAYGIGALGRRQRIDVWWGGLQDNGGLMLTLAYLLQTSFAWRGAELRVKMVVPNEDAATRAQANLERIVQGLRTDAKSEAIVGGERPFLEIFRESSRGADFVFIGMRDPDDEWEAYYKSIQAGVKGLPSTAFVLAAEDLAFGEILMKSED